MSIAIFEARVRDFGTYGKKLVALIDNGLTLKEAELKVGKPPDGYDKLLETCWVAVYMSALQANYINAGLFEQLRGNQPEGILRRYFHDVARTYEFYSVKGGENFTPHGFGIYWFTRPPAAGPRAFIPVKHVMVCIENKYAAGSNNGIINPTGAYVLFATYDLEKCLTWDLIHNCWKDPNGGLVEVVWTDAKILKGETL